MIEIAQGLRCSQWLDLSHHPFKQIIEELCGCSMREALNYRDPHVLNALARALARALTHALALDVD